MSSTSISLKNVYDGGSSHHFEDLPVTMLVKDFKVLVQDLLPSHPSPLMQRLIHCGKICDDNTALESYVSKRSSEANYDGTPHTFHLVLSTGSSANLQRTMSEPPKPTAAERRAAEAAERLQASTVRDGGGASPSSPPPSGGSLQRSVTAPSSSLSRSEARAAAVRAAEARATAAASNASLSEALRKLPQSAPPKLTSVPPQDEAPLQGVARRVSFSEDTTAELPTSPPPPLPPYPPSAPSASGSAISYEAAYAQAVGLSVGGAPSASQMAFHEHALAQHALARQAMEVEYSLTMQFVDTLLAWRAHVAAAAAVSGHTTGHMGLGVSSAQKAWTSHNSQHHAPSSTAAAEYAGKGYATSVEDALAAAASYRQGTTTAGLWLGRGAPPSSSSGAPWLTQQSLVGGAPGTSPHPAAAMATPPTWQFLGARINDTEAASRDAAALCHHHNHHNNHHQQQQQQEHADMARQQQQPGVAAEEAVGLRQPNQEQEPRVDPQQPAPAGAPPVPGGGGARGVAFLFLDGEDVKLALKLAVVVLLLSQDGSPRKLIALSCAAVAAFVWQVVAARRERRDRARPNNNRVGAGGPPQQRREEAEAEAEGSEEALPPLRVRGVVEGGIAPSGGVAMDLTYLVLSFCFSLAPAWSPRPAFDPDEVLRRRMLEFRLAQHRAAQRAEANLGRGESGDEDSESESEDGEAGSEDSDEREVEPDSERE